MTKESKHNPMKAAKAARGPKHIGGKWDMRIAKFLLAPLALFLIYLPGQKVEAEEELQEKDRKIADLQDRMDAIWKMLDSALLEKSAQAARISQLERRLEGEVAGGVSDSTEVGEDGSFVPPTPDSFD